MKLLPLNQLGSHETHLVEFTMEEHGDYVEQLHQVDNFSLAENNSAVLLKIPGNYGRVLDKKIIYWVPKPHFTTCDFRYSYLHPIGSGK